MVGICPQGYVPAGAVAFSNATERERAPTIHYDILLGVSWPRPIKPRGLSASKKKKKKKKKNTLGSRKELRYDTSNNSR